MERGEGQRERQIFQKLFTADILQKSFCQNSCTAPEQSCCKTGKKEREYGPCEKNFPDPFFISEGIFSGNLMRDGGIQTGRGKRKSQSKDGKNHLVESEAVCTNAP